MDRYVLGFICLQGGGLFLLGKAKLTNTNIYANTASQVRARLLNLPRPFLHRPDGMLRAPLFALQGGGLYIRGTATLTNTNVYSNTASSVCSPFRPCLDLSSIAPLN